MSEKRSYWLHLIDGTQLVVAWPEHGSADIELRKFVSQLEAQRGIQVGVLWVPWHSIVKIQIR